MPKYVKTVFDGEVYWLLWSWQAFQPIPLPTIPAGFHYANGPFDSVEKAREAVTEGWTLIDYKL